MTGGHPQQQLKREMISLEQGAALENHLRLQQSQEDFLKWLEASEMRQDIDQYAFKKIR
ncbi:MAG TPA: hypothetical protein V6C99_03350 [Oculatellaceae cyanobacterium]|jgi:hypothetical protein